TLALRLSRNSKPPVQKLSASVLLVRCRDYRLRIHLAIEVAEQLAFVISDRLGILAEIAGAENAAGKLPKLLGFYGEEKPQADLGPIRDLFKRNARFLAESGKIQRVNNGRRGRHSGAGLFRGHVVLKRVVMV